MADTNSYTKLQENPSKFYNQFLYKALIVSFFLVLLPLFPSQAPKIFNQTALTGSWELLHLIFVGIAVSYGLFSRLQDESDKENNTSNFDNAQSYVSGILQVSSVFDEESEIPSGSEENKIQTWSNQYCMKEPAVSVLEKQRSEKALLLPVRSLKQSSSNPDVVESSSQFMSNSNSGSKRVSSNSNRLRNGDFGGVDYKELEEKLKEIVALPSPIPWRSRSGRMEMKKEVDAPAIEESRSFRCQTVSASSSPKLSPSPSLFSPAKSSESQVKNAEEFVRKKSVHRYSPPPPPPPPPPINRKSPLMKSSSCSVNDGDFSEKLNRANAGVEAKQRSQIEANLKENSRGKPSRFSDFSKDEKKDEIVEEVVLDSDADSESEEEDDIEGIQEINEIGGGKQDSVSDAGPDVDKKADEFIAKFREQIRLQRIESIKRSTKQISRNSSG